jgi:hypothetical protein
MENPKIETENQPQKTLGKTTNTIINNDKNTLHSIDLFRPEAGNRFFPSLLFNQR